MNDSKVSAPAAKSSGAQSDQADLASGNEPIIVDLGKKKRKDVRKLRKGKSGRLMNRVEDALEHLRNSGALAKGAVPVIFVVAEKTPRAGRRMEKMWGIG